MNRWSSFQLAPARSYRMRQSPSLVLGLRTTLEYRTSCRGKGYSMGHNEFAPAALVTWLSLNTVWKPLCAWMDRSRVQRFDVLQRVSCQCCSRTQCQTAATWCLAVLCLQTVQNPRAVKLVVSTGSRDKQPSAPASLVAMYMWLNGPIHCRRPPATRTAPHPSMTRSFVSSVKWGSCLG